MPNENDQQFIKSITGVPQPLVSVTDTALPRRQIDWITIEAEYVHGCLTVDPTTGTRVMHFPSQAELGEKYKVDPRRIAERSRTEKWVPRRELYKQKIKRRIGQERVNSLMSESARYDAKNLILLDKIYEQLEIWLDNEHLQSQTESSDTPVSPFERTHKIKNLEVAINLLNKGHTLVRNIMGEPVNAEKIVNELMELQQLEEAELAKKHKPGQKSGSRINNLLKSVESRQEVLETLMRKKREIESQMEDLEE
jgi:hypothetical protein